MKQVSMLFLLATALFPHPLLAGDKNDNTSSFWVKLRSKVESLTPQKKLEVTTATGGVRGAPAAFEDMYWKDDAASAQTIGSDELAGFAAAMKLIDSADKEHARAAFSGFVKKYPESSLRKDADQAIVMLQERPGVRQETP